MLWQSNGQISSKENMELVQNDKATINQEEDRPLNDVLIEFTNGDIERINKVEYYTVNSGMLVIQAQGENLVAYNLNNVFKFTDIVNKENN